MGIIYTPSEPDHVCQPGTHVNGSGERITTPIAVPGSRWKCDVPDCPDWKRVWMAHEELGMSGPTLEWRVETRREARQRRREIRRRNAGRLDYP